MSEWTEPIVIPLRRLWQRRGETVLRCAVALMAVVASVWLGYQLWRLLWQQGYWGAIDLKTYHRLVHSWFAGISIYTAIKTAVHPPATYIILWPLMGWLDFDPTRWIWAIGTIAVLVWLIRIIVRESKADTPVERAFVAMLPLSMYATGATIGNGQLIIHVLPLLLTGIFYFCRERPVWRKDAMAALLVLFALVKPSVSAPFIWIVFFCSGRPRPAALVLSGYLGLTVFASLFQTDDLPTLLSNWLANPALGQPGQTNLRAWLLALGLKEKEWSFAVSILALAAQGLWVYRYRRIDIWILIGVTALVARLAMYHRWYDDLLILLPMVALFRTAKLADGEKHGALAGVLLAMCAFAMLAPGGLYLLPAPWDVIYTTGQALIWSLVLIFLLGEANRRQRENTRRIDRDVNAG